MLEELSQEHKQVLKYSLEPKSFIKDVLGWTVKDFHGEWLDFWKNNDKTLLLAPRSSGKTTMLTAYIIWRIVTNPDTRILYLTIKDDKAIEVADNIKYHLDSNPQLTEIFGSQRGNLWTRRSFNVKGRKRGGASRAPTFTGAGIGSSEVGGHYSAIALDDVVNRENAATKHRRQSMKENYDSMVDYMLEPEGEIHCIGTRYHEDDLYSSLMEYSGYKTKRYEGILQWNREDIGKIISPPEDKIGDKGISLWPERMSYEELLDKLKDKGSYWFFMQTQNEVLSKQGSMFKKEYMNNAYKLQNLDLHNMETYMGVDLATVSGGDYFAIVIVGFKDGNIYILDVFRDRLTIGDQLDKVIEKDDMWSPTKIAIESNQYQSAFSSELMSVSSLPVEKVNPQRNKELRAQRLAALMESGRVFFRERGLEYNEALQHELAVFPDGKHDDMLDALVHAVNIIGGKKKKRSWSKIADSIWTGNSKKRSKTPTVSTL